MKSRKKLITVEAIVMIFVLLISGCSTKSKSEVPAESNTSNDIVKESENKHEEKNELGRDKITIAYPARYDMPTYDSMKYFDLIEEMANVDVEWIEWDQGAAKDKMQTAFATNTQPDIILLVADPNDVVSLSQDKQIVAIDEYFDYAPNMKALLEKRPDFKGLCTLPDGHIYGMPGYLEDGTTSSQSAMYNPTWLNAAGAKVPTNLDEFYDALKKVKALGDYNKNGVDDEIPWTFSSSLKTRHIAGINWMLAAFNIISCDTGTPYEVNNGVVTHTYLNENYKDFFKYMHKLYSEGLIDPTFSTDEQAEISTKCSSPDPIVCFTQTWLPDNYNTAISDNKNKYVIMDALNGIDGKQHWLRRTPNFAIGRAIITTKCKNIEAAVRWIDANMDPDMVIQARYGIKGKWLIDNGDGTFTQKLTENQTVPAEQDICAEVPSQFYGIVTNDNYKRIKCEIKIPKEEACAMYEPYLLPLEGTYPTSAIKTADEVSIISDIEVNIDSYYLQMFADFVTNGNVDEGWDNYIKTLKDLQIEKLNEIGQAVYNRTYGDK